MADFTHLATDKAAIGSIVVDKMPSETRWQGSKDLQAGRLRMAWKSALRAAEAVASGTKSSVTDEGDLLPAGQLEQLEQRWWQRYRNLPDPHRCPTDYSVTAADRQLI